MKYHVVSLGLAAALSLLLCLAGKTGVMADEPEFRAFWVDAFHSGIKTSAQADQLLADVRAANCNAVVCQVRRRGDTYYPSPYEPFAADADPDFDALAYLIEKAHSGEPRVEVHAWLCTLPIASSVPSQPDHPFFRYPQYLSKLANGALHDGSNYNFDPGHPGALEYLTNVYLDVARRYDVDGINYDIVRFANTSCGYNEVSIARFNGRFGRKGKPDPSDPDWMQWRRDQITALVRKVYANVMAEKPHIKVSAATIPWGEGPLDEDDWYDTRAYTQVLQDWRAWMEEGIIDLNIPMNYNREYEDEDPNNQKLWYRQWIAWEKDHQYARQCAVGPGIYLNSIADSIIQMRLVREPGNSGGRAVGMCLYSYAVTNKDGLPRSEFIRAVTEPSEYDPITPAIFHTPVGVPDMPWKSNPTRGHIKGTATAGGHWMDGARISISGPVERSMIADGTGFYAFIDLPPGTYRVTADCATGVRTRTAAVSAGQVTTVDFEMPLRAPSISAVTVTAVGSSEFTVCWFTDMPATGWVEYGTTRSLGSSTSEDTQVMLGHSSTIIGLASHTPYYFRVASQNAASSAPTYSSVYCVLTSFIPASVIVDNPAGIPFPDEASWQTGTSATNKYGTNYRFCNAEPAGTKTFRWTPNLPSAGDYEVYIWYPHGSNRCSQSPFTVYYDGGSQTFLVNQKSNGGKWNLLGTFHFGGGSSGYVELANIGPSGVVVADAVKWQQVIVDQEAPSSPEPVVVAEERIDRIVLNWNASADPSGVAGYKLYRNGDLIDVCTDTSYVDVLPPNSLYSYSLEAYDVFGNTSQRTPEVAACTLSVPPSPASVIASRSAGIWMTGPDITFVAVGGFGPGTLAYYRFVWNQNASHVWTGDEPVWAADTITEFAASSANPWYFHVQGYNAAGVANGTLTLGPFYYQFSFSAPTVMDEGEYTPSRTNFRAWWIASDPQSGGIISYKYCVGTSAGASDLCAWTETTSDSAEVVVPELPYGTRCFWTVKARNAQGMWSLEGSSNGITVAHPVSSILEAKSFNGEPVYFTVEKTITAVFDDCFYIQESDEYRGLRVDTIGGEQGRLAAVAGIVARSAGEWRLMQAECRMGDQVPLPLAVGMTCRTIGGTGDDLNPEPSAVVKCWRWVKVGSMTWIRKFLPVPGLMNTCLLVKTWGKVSFVGDGYFYLSDGSGYDDTEAADPPGLRVALPVGMAPPQIGQGLVVTGISSCYGFGGDLYRLLRPRSAEDIWLLQVP